MTKWKAEEKIELGKEYEIHLDTRSQYTTLDQFESQMREQFGEDTLAEIKIQVECVY